MTRSFACCVVLLTLLRPSSAAAQVGGLTAGLDSVSAVAIHATLETARAEGLPLEPLRNKVIEGISKGANGPLIADVIERLRTRLSRASASLGPDANTADLVAAAAVLDLGVTDRELARIRSARPDRPIASALVGLAFLLQRGAARDGAIEVVHDMLVARVPDSAFDRFRESVARDLQAGAPATGAARARANAAILRVRRGGGPPAATVS